MLLHDSILFKRLNVLHSSAFVTDGISFQFEQQQTKEHLGVSYL